MLCYVTLRSVMLNELCLVEAPTNAKTKNKVVAKTKDIKLKK